jgi:uncharacterized protein YoxC
MANPDFTGHAQEALKMLSELQEIIQTVTPILLESRSSYGATKANEILEECNAALATLTDTSVPIDQMAEVVRDLRKRVGDLVTSVTRAH